jgi:hypothetical protein
MGQGDERSTERHSDRVYRVGTDAGSHTDERLPGPPDFKEQPIGTQPRSRTDLKRARILVRNLPASRSCPIRARRGSPSRVITVTRGQQFARRHLAYAAGQGRRADLIRKRSAFRPLTTLSQTGEPIQDSNSCAGYLMDPDLRNWTPVDSTDAAHETTDQMPALLPRGRPTVTR